MILIGLSLWMDYSVAPKAFCSFIGLIPLPELFSLIYTFAPGGSLSFLHHGNLYAFIFLSHPCLHHVICHNDSCPVVLGPSLYDAARFSTYRLMGSGHVWVSHRFSSLLCKFDPNADTVL